MSIATAITGLQGRIANAYAAISNKGGTLPATQDSANLSGAIDSIPAGGGGGDPIWGINALSDVCYTDANGVGKLFGGVSGALTFTGLSGIADNGFEYGFRNNTGITSVVFPDLNSAGNDSMQYAFQNCASLASASFPSLSAVTIGSLFHAFDNCTSLTSVSFQELADISGGGSTTTVHGPFEQAFNNCTQLVSLSFPKLSSSTAHNCFEGAFQNTAVTTVSFPELTSIGGTDAFKATFKGCTSLTSVSFPKLQEIKGVYAFGECFNNCTSLTELSFPELTTITNAGTSSSSNTFRSNGAITKIYFPKLTTITSNSATTGLTGKFLFSLCTNLVEIHFAEANQTLIESADGYATKWGAPNANCQVYFDL